MMGLLLTAVGQRPIPSGRRGFVRTLVCTELISDSERAAAIKVKTRIRARDPTANNNILNDGIIYYARRQTAEPSGIRKPSNAHRPHAFDSRLGGAEKSR